MPKVTQLLSGGTEKSKICPNNKNQVSSVSEPKRKKKKNLTDKAVISKCSNSSAFQRVLITGALL